MVEQESHNHRHERNHKNIFKHPQGIYFHLRACEPKHQQRRYERRQERRNGGHTHRESHIALAQKAHNIARHATRAASHQDYAHREVRVETEHTRESPCHERHNGVLCNGAYADVDGVLCKHLKIVESECATHGEHNDAQNHTCAAFLLHPCECSRHKKRPNSHSYHCPRCVGG